MSHHYASILAQGACQPSEQPKQRISQWPLKCFGRGQQSRDLSRKQDFHDDVKVGDVLFHQGVCYWIVVKIDGDRTFQCIHPFGNELIRMSHAQIIEGIRKMNEIEDQNLQDVQDKLPVWALRREVGLKCNSLSVCVGPVIPWLRVGAAGCITVQVAIFWIEHGARGFSMFASAYPLLFAFIVFIVFVTRACVEWMALVHALPAFAKSCAFKLVGVPVSTTVWLFANLVLSQLSFIDISTDSLFTSSALQMLEHQEIANKIWHQVWAKSMLHVVPVPSLWLLVIVSWTLSLLQILIPVMRTIRMSDLRLQTSYKIGHQGPSPTLCNREKMRHSAVFEGLADANGMATLQAMSIPWNSWACDDRYQDPHQGHVLANIVGEKMIKFRQFVDQMLERVILSYCLENDAQINLQSTLYCISIAVARLTGAKHQVGVVAAVSMAITMLTSLLKLVDALQFFKIVIVTVDLPARLDPDAELESMFIAKQIRWEALAVAFSCALLFTSLVYAGVKIVMAHICEDIVWNITGCVNLQMV